MNKDSSLANQPLVPLHTLWFFEAVAHQKSFTKASKVLSVTQSAVSKQVRNLENNLGLELFERRCTEVTLTEAGAMLLEGVQPLLASLKQIVRTLPQPTQRDPG